MRRRQDRGPAARIAFVGLAIVAVWIGGCSDSETVLELPSWSLSHEGTDAQVVKLPGKLPVRPRGATYVLRTDVRLPSTFRGEDLQFVIPHFQARARLRANGLLLPLDDPAMEELYAPNLPHVWRIPRESTVTEILTLTIEIDDRWTGSRRLETMPKLVRGHGELPSVRLARAVNRDLAIVTALLCVTMSFLFFAKFAGDPRQKLHLILALAAAVVIIYPLFVSGALDTFVGFRDRPLAGFGAATTIVLMVFFLHVRFGLERPSFIWTLALVAPWPGMMLPPDPYWTQWIVAVTGIPTIMGGIFYLLARSARVALRRDAPPGAGIYFWCWLVMSAVGWPDQVIFFGVPHAFGGLHLSNLGISAIIFLMAVLVTHDYIGYVRRTEHLTQELSNRLQLLEDGEREIRTLNAELERKILDRSTELREALRSAAEAAQLSLDEGTVVEGRYRIGPLLGRGGMGNVYEAIRLADGRPVALKVAHGLSAATLARLAREAHVAAKMEHPNIVALYDVDIASEGYLFLVMELVRGGTLEGYRCDGRAARDLDVYRQIVDALGALHAVGIVHRDLKPANVMLLRDPSTGKLQAKLTDFGISRGSSTASLLVDTLAVEEEPDAPASSTGAYEVTRMGVVSGTPVYMAPELGRATDALDGSMDIFALGVMAHVTFAGRLPFPEPAITYVMRGEPVPDVTPLRTLCPALSSRIADLFDRCLSTDPHERPTLAELDEALREAVRQATDGQHSDARTDRSPSDARDEREGGDPESRNPGRESVRT